MTDQNNQQVDPKVDLAKKLEEAAQDASKKDKGDLAEILEEKNAEIEKLKKELTDMTELARRTMADMQNLRRHTEEERVETILMANYDLVKRLLPVLTTLELAEKHVPDKAADWYKGIDMAIKDMYKALEEIGLQKIETVGKPFDPNFHEALLHEAGEKDMVLEEFEAGYILGKRVIRHAKVKVGNGEISGPKPQSVGAPRK
ncbi:MAG: nucleotide exchange factor GrpE [Candidatus Gracilibacteria bacterium]|nr:nucleotide exchange factor GrpE [Candidatus Gracilibacteria bacterium]